MMNTRPYYSHNACDTKLIDDPMGRIRTIKDMPARVERVAKILGFGKKGSPKPIPYRFLLDSMKESDHFASAVKSIFPSLNGTYAFDMNKSYKDSDTVHVLNILDSIGAIQTSGRYTEKRITLSKGGGKTIRAWLTIERSKRAARIERFQTKGY
jgi:hypothetical protein